MPWLMPRLAITSDDVQGLLLKSLHLAMRSVIDGQDIWYPIKMCLGEDFQEVKQIHKLSRIQKL